MIVRPTLQSLLKRNPSKYSLVIGTAKRARQISQGSPKLTNVKAESDVDSFLGGFVGDLFTKNIHGLDDFELICFLVIK